jgi:hypothetical protein
MHLIDFVKAFDHKIVGGSPHLWDCFGSNSRYLDFESEYAYGSIIFDSKNQVVYQAEVSAKEDGNDGLPGPYRWVNPDYLEAYVAECKKRNVEPFEAWDDVRYVQIDVAEDFFEKANAIFNNMPFDSRVTVPLNLDNDTILQLALEAHKRDITINQMVAIVLQNVIDEHKGVNG